MAKSEKTAREKLEEFLNEKNYFTDGLAFVEQKTGINRLYLFGGKIHKIYFPSILNTPFLSK